MPANLHFMSIGTCHVAHFLLFQLLKPLLLSSATPEYPSRVVVVASYGHRTGEVRFDDYNFEKSPYDPWAAYGQAKTANIYMSNEVERRYGAANLHSTSLHPGGIATPLQDHLGDMVSSSMTDPAIHNYMKSIPQGAATSVYAAVSAEWAQKGGRYLADCAEAGPFKGESAMATGDDGYATWAYDEPKAKRLWEESCKMVGVPED